MKTWYTADWHLGEDRFEIMSRPFSTQMEMVETLINNHNKLVAPDDLVIVVGDVCYQKTPEYLKYVAEFNGRKVLIRGNHDRNISDEQFGEYFEQIVKEGEGLVMQIAGKPFFVTHYPTRGLTGYFNVVGHIHAAWKFQLNMVNVGVDVHHFRPVPQDNIPKYVKAISEFYDEDVWVAYEDVNGAFKDARGKKSRYFNP